MPFGFSSIGIWSFVSLFALDLAFFSDLSLALVVEVQALRVGLAPRELFPLALDFLLGHWVLAEN